MLDRLIALFAVTAALIGIAVRVQGGALFVTGEFAVDLALVKDDKARSKPSPGLPLRRPPLRWILPEKIASDPNSPHDMLKAFAESMGYTTVDIDKL